MWLLARPPRLLPPASKAQQPFTSAEQILRFIDQYHLKPQPERLPELVQAMSGLGLFRDLEAAGVHVGFMAGVLDSNPEKAEALVAKMFPIPPEDQVAIVRAIAYSGLPDWKGMLGRFTERMPARAVLIQRLIEGKLPTLQTAPMEKGPVVLDTNWGYYFATRSPEPIDRIIATLAWASEKDDIEKLTIAGMAKWTLANNSSRDMDLLSPSERAGGRPQQAGGGNFERHNRGGGNVGTRSHPQGCRRRDR